MRHNNHSIIRILRQREGIISKTNHQGRCERQDKGQGSGIALNVAEPFSAPVLKVCRVQTGGTDGDSAAPTCREMKSVYLFNLNT